MPNVAASSSLDTSLKELLEGIGKGAVQLPEFQRGWTWDDLHIRAILASLTQGYPMGAVMCLQCGGEARFKARPFEGAGAPQGKPEFLVLDGQQRLTSIFRAAWAREPVDTKTEKDQPVRRFYYLDIAKCLNPEEDRFDAVISVPEDRVVRTNFNRDVVLDLSTPGKEYAAGMFPLNIAFDSDAREDWADGYKDFHGDTEECRERYKQFRKEVLNVVTAYKLPVITLSRETPAAAVCQVFEHVNTGGVPLTVFELVTASFAADDFDLRRDWTERVCPAVRGEGEKLATDVMQAVSEKDFLAAVTLYASHERRLREGRETGSSCKRKDILALTLADYLACRDAAVEGFRLARKFLLSQFVFRQRDLPYATQLIPLAAICAAAGASLLGHPKARDVLARWYWCGVFGEMYGGTTDTIFAADMDDVPRAMQAAADGKPAVPVRTADAAFFSAVRLLTMRSRNSAAYKGVMALVYRAGGLDFRNGTSMNAVCAMEESPDIHHVFPKRWCLDSGDPDVLAKMDSIVNKTPLLPVSNRAIGGAAPRDYAQKIMKEAGIGEEELRKRVESHFVDWDAFMAGDFQRHFVQRAKRLLDLVGRAMGRVVADRGSAQTVERFGASLEDEGQGPEPGPVAEAPVDPRAEGGWASAPPEEASAGGGMQDGIPAVNASPAAASAWEELNRRVAALAPDVEIRPSPRQDYAAFLIQGRRFLAARLQKRDVKLFLGAKGGKLDDPQGLTVPSPWNQEGERQASIADAAGVEAAMSLVRQALELARTGGKAGAEETFTEEALLAAGGPEVTALYASLKARVLALGGVSVEPRKLYAAFRTDGRLFLSVTVLKSRLKIFFNVKKGALNDPDVLAEDVSAKGHWGPGDYQADAADEARLDALMPLIRQAFEAAVQESVLNGGGDS